MSKNDIIEKLFTGKNFNDCLQKMEPDYLREDLKQEVILIVCEWSEDKIIKLHKDGALDFYVVKVILNQIKSNTSPFAKKYRQYVVEYNGLHVNGDWENDKQTGQEWVKDKVNFFTKRSSDLEKDESIDLEERGLREMIEDMAVEEVDKLHWYDKGLIELYMKHGSFRAIQAQTKIPHVSAYKTIKKAFAGIKKKMTAK